MTPDQERKVLETLYDRLYDALTYDSGGGKSGDFDRATTVLQMTKNYVLNPNDFRNDYSAKLNKLVFAIDGASRSTEEYLATSHAT
ncbi:phage repressor protein C with HTH and peptisase S24 domain [Paraburkholderia atlantica]|uniref:hypothetical protein n=1 Tax=Paraburkholderia atlantica TaxID=2654982 RepID=UPI003D1E19D6